MNNYNVEIIVKRVENNQQSGKDEQENEDRTGKRKVGRGTMERMGRRQIEDSNGRLYPCPVLHNNFYIIKD